MLYAGDNSAPDRRILPIRMNSAQMRTVGIQRATYAPFRESFFFDPHVNAAFKTGGQHVDRLVYARNSKRLWTTRGPIIDPRLPKTTVKPGTAFRNACFSPDQLYSSSRDTMGYDAHRSLRGSSLCSTTKRFNNKSSTPECVGPGSYDVMQKLRGLLTVPQPRQQGDPKRLVQRSEQQDARPMDSADEWKFTSEIPSATKSSFRKARASTWIEQVEQRQRREDPLARKPVLCLTVRPEQRLPQYLQGTSNCVHTNTATRSTKFSPS